MWRTVLVCSVVVAIAACGESAETYIDAPPSTDAPPVDAAVDAAAPDGPSPDAAFGCPSTGTETGYVVASVTVPTTNNAAMALGFDLDGDGNVDNQFGAILTALASSGGSTSDPQQGIDGAITAGDVIVVASLREDSGAACLTTDRGTNPVPAACTDPQVPATCGQHLQGTATITRVSAEDRSIPGALASGTFTSGSGQAVVPLALGGHGGGVAVEVELARAELTGVTATGFTGGKLGGAIPELVVQEVVIPALHQDVTAQIALDCTGTGTNCGCVESSTGQTLLQLFDADDDCSVTLPELADASLIQTLFAPDVDADGDGTNDALSIGVGITGVSAQLQ